MDCFKLNGPPPHMCFSQLLIRGYEPVEVERLSVLEMTQTKTFDEVGHAIRGGLYDPLLGPCELGDSCASCNERSLNCPGHFGHIHFDIPLINPVFFPFVQQLLKGSCVQCHRLTCNGKGLPVKLLLAQLHCLDKGSVMGAQHLSALFQKLESDPVEEQEPADFMRLVAEMDAQIDQSNQLDEQGENFVFLKPSRNSVELKKSIIQQFQRKYLFKNVRRCPLCKRRNASLRNDGNRCFLLDFSTKARATAAKKMKKTVVDSKPKTDNTFLDPMIDDQALAAEIKAQIKTEEASASLPGVETGTLAAQMNCVSSGECETLVWRAGEVREHFRLLWNNDGNLLARIFPLFNSNGTDTGICPMDILFCEHLLVPPSKYRPVRELHGDKYEHPQTVNFRKLLEANQVVRTISLAVQGSQDVYVQEYLAHRLQGKSLHAKLHQACLELQNRLNLIYDEESEKISTSNNAIRIPGIRQLLEKKAGLFRMNMMGKRVNYACRSVITPDPYLDVDEIGIPEVFAKRLTINEPVTALNVTQLRNLVKNGPNHHPGANFVIKGNWRSAISNGKWSERNAIASRLTFAEPTRSAAASQVVRHLTRGDMLLMNRQPSLHKPSIMGHRVRVLKGQRALRMNYAPCKAYNADFDGDEMNGHFVQNRVAQTEVSELATVGCNYLVPKDGSPILGLIQDHIVAGVLLTMRGRFLERDDFSQLLLAAFAETPQRLRLPTPAILHPRRLYTGKQLISTILMNCVPSSSALLNLTSTAKTPPSCWQKTNDPVLMSLTDSTIIFRQGQLLCGVLDAASCGSARFGLIHSCFELYGPRVAVRILSCFSRLFTTFLQQHGFTLSVADILVKAEADLTRKSEVRKFRVAGQEVARTLFSLDTESGEEEIRYALATAYCHPRGDTGHVQQLDFSMKQISDQITDSINKVCIPDGLVRSFPDNALQLMIRSGAKGSPSNASEISSCRGQVELEGKRPPVTATGRSLPSFHCFDSSPRAGGFVEQRYLTGFKPQELFFATMAGREGLIDTAVKTSRSGYLQRCIIKHLEGLVVHYDRTVRDHDNSVIQFRYGEDGLDVGRAGFLENRPSFLTENASALGKAPRSLFDGVDEVGMSKNIAKIIKRRGTKTMKKIYGSGFLDFADLFVRANPGADSGAVKEAWFALEEKERRSLWRRRLRRRCPDPLDAGNRFDNGWGLLSEKLMETVEGVGEEKRRRALYWKALRARADPGENVGLVAAQSIGEPSTQMTLNTFHFAGRSEMNVTLGIPRLREILMTTSKSISTPTAQVSALENADVEELNKVKVDLNRIYLHQLIKAFSVEERVNLATLGKCHRSYLLRIDLLNGRDRDVSTRHLKRSAIMEQIELRFIRQLSIGIGRRLREMTVDQQISHSKLAAGNAAAGINADLNEETSSRRGARGNEEGASSDEEVGEGDELDAGEARLRSRHNDIAAEYEGEEGEVEEMHREDEQDDDEDEEISPLGPSELAMDDGENVLMDEAQLKTMEQQREKRQKLAVDARKQRVVHKTEHVSAYEFDERSERWCRVTFQLPLNGKCAVDVAAIVQREVDSFIVFQTAGIEKCVLIEGKIDANGQKTERDIIQTQGVNMQALYQRSRVLDVNTIYTNDVDCILRHYGIEACARAIRQEMSTVFGNYGIKVNPRHLTLVADYMTFTGVVTPFARQAMLSSASPLQKMTFETTMNFMRDAIVSGDVDYLQSPSARLVVGQVIRGGTGCFDLIVPKDFLIGQNEKKKKTM